MIADMHKYGIRVDLPFLRSLDAKVTGRIADFDADIRGIIGNSYQDYDGKKHTPFNAASPDHVARLLFKHLQIQKGTPLRMTPTQRREEVGDDVLSAFRHVHPVVPLIQGRREVAKLHNTYTLPLQLQADSESRIHTRFSVTTAATGRLSSIDPNCFDEQTELLTQSGWKKINTLLGTDLVAQWDNGTIKLVSPTGYVSKWSDAVIAINSQHVDLKVTEDHRCLLVHRKTGEQRVFPAYVYPEDWKQLNAGCYSGSGCRLTHDEIRFMLAIQADGSWIDGSECLDFTFKKKRKIERFKRLLKSLNIEHTHNEEAARKRFYIPSGVVTKKLRAVLGADKLFPWDLLFSMSAEELDVVIDECMNWDGCYTRNNHYASKHRHNADWISTVYTLRNRRAVVRRYVNGLGSVSWQVDVTRKNYSMTTNRAVTSCRAAEMVYCVSVPSSYLLVRRNGKTMITGNCQNIPVRTELGREVRRAFIASPGCDLVSCDLSQIEMVWAAHRSKDPVMMEVFRKGEDIHTRTTCNVFGLDYNWMIKLTRLVDSGNATPEQEKEYKHFKQFQRLPCKTVGFGVLYGQTAEGLQQGLASDGVVWSLEECAKLIDVDFFGVYPGLKEMLYRDHHTALKYAMIWDAFGRVRLVPEARSSHKRIKMEGVRKAGNHPEQASAQGGLKLAMAELNPMCRELNKSYICRPLLQIHDQLIVECSKGLSNEFAPMAQYVMEGAVKLDIQVRSSSDIAETWFDL